MAISTGHGQHNQLQKFKQIALNDSEDNEEELEDDAINMGGSNCTVCLGPRILTWLLMPCRHATFCTNCSQQLIDLGSPAQYVAVT